MRMTEGLKLVLAGAVLVSGACKNIDAPDQNASTLQELTGTPTRAVVISSLQGLFGGLRAAGPCTGNCAYLGREGMNLDPSNPQNVNVTYFNGGDFSQWTSTYQNNRQADIVLEAIGKLSSDGVTGMTDVQKAGARGIVYTAKALGLLYVILTTDQTGAVLDVPTDPTAPVPAISSRDAAYTRIRALLDSGLTQLNTPGAVFTGITFPAGFTSNGTFNNVNGFRAFNRAIRARANVYWGTPASFADALVDLNAVFTGTGTPFVAVPNTLAQMQIGVYNTYSTTSGDATNGVFDATDRQRFAHTSLAQEAVIRTGTDTTTRDARFLRKVRTVKGDSLSRYGFKVYWAFQAYNSLSDPIPVLRNEEMLLLRAEATLACTGSAPAVTCPGDHNAALTDINTVRRVSGGLADLPAPPSPLAAGRTTGDGTLDELLYNKRYSLVWEGGYSWYDRRHYGALTTLKRDTLLGVVTKFFPYSRLPDAECNARGIAIGTGLCTIPTGL
jgi:starch-binding outer membrane protein, SusD/RagB family